LSARRLIFIDETGATTNMVRRYGRSPRGQRVKGYAPNGHWKMTTFVAGLTADGIIAPLVVDQPMNRAIFTQFVRQFLAPQLAPGDIVIMDNLSSHKGVEVSALIEARGAELLFLPPYSPDLNPIENAFAKLKELRARQPSEPGKTCGTESECSSASSRPRNAQTTFVMPDMRNRDRKSL
jgi:transposase